MKFAWDEAKRLTNLEKHAIDVVGIEQIFAGVTVTILDDRFDYGEDRFVTFGLLDGRVLAITHTETDETIRIISARKATNYEEISYYEEIAN